MQKQAAVSDNANLIGENEMLKERLEDTQERLSATKMQLRANQTEEIKLLQDRLEKYEKSTREFIAERHKLNSELQNARNDIQALKEDKENEHKRVSEERLAHAKTLKDNIAVKEELDDCRKKVAQLESEAEDWHGHWKSLYTAMQEMRVGVHDQKIEVLLVQQSKLSRGEKMSKVGRHRRNSSTVSRDSTTFDSIKSPSIEMPPPMIYVHSNSPSEDLKGLHA